MKVMATFEMLSPFEQELVARNWMQVVFIHKSNRRE